MTNRHEMDGAHSHILLHVYVRLKCIYVLVARWMVVGWLRHTTVAKSHLDTMQCIIINIK